MKPEVASAPQPGVAQRTPGSDDTQKTETPKWVPPVGDEIDDITFPIFIAVNVILNWKARCAEPTSGFFGCSSVIVPGVRYATPGCGAELRWSSEITYSLLTQGAPAATLGL